MDNPDCRVYYSGVSYKHNNDHKRTWFKTEGIDFDGSPNAEAFNRTSWSNVIRAVNTGAALGGLIAAQMQQIPDGGRDTLLGSIQIRSNAREYFSRGIQFGLNWAGMTGPALSLQARILRTVQGRGSQ